MQRAIKRLPTLMDFKWPEIIRRTSLIAVKTKIVTRPEENGRRKKQMSRKSLGNPYAKNLIKFLRETSQRG